MPDANDPTLTGGGPAAAPDLPASRRVGDYDLVDELARGAMGVVFRARQRSLNRPVALKMILSGEFASPTELQRFRQEAEAAARLDHPNILPIYDVGEHDGRAYFSMKLAERGTLADRMAEVRKDLTAAVRLIEQVARGVHHAHQRGILHRDLKPANVLLADPEDSGASHVPLVADFGLAKRTEADSTLTQSGAIVGTPSYMAPEQAKGSKAVTTAADVYSLGAILYEVLAGRPPFRGATVAQTLHMVEHDEPVPPRSVNAQADADLEAVALKCLEKDPSLRYETAGALADELGSWVRGEPVTARRAGWVRRARKWIRRNPAVAALSVAVLLALVAGSVVSSVYAVRAGQRASEARESEKEARGHEAEVRRREAALQDLLAASDYQQARALRLAGRPGWRDKSLQLLARSASARNRVRGEDDPPMPEDQPSLADLRSEAVMALTSEDVRELRTLSPGFGRPVIDPAGGRLVRLGVLGDPASVFTGAVVDLATGAVVAETEARLKPETKGKDGSTIWLVFIEALDSAGRVACVDPSGEGRIDLREFTTGKVVLELELPKDAKASAAVEWARFSPDERRLLVQLRVGGDAELGVWDLGAKPSYRALDRRPSTFKGGLMNRDVFPRGEYRHAAFSSDSKRVAYPSADGKAMLVRDLAGDPKAEPTRVAADEKIVAACWHPTRPRLALLTGGKGSAELTLHDVGEAKPALRRGLPFSVPDNVRGVSIAFRRDGDALALSDGGSEGTVRVLGGDDLGDRLAILHDTILGVGGVFWTAGGDLCVVPLMEDLRLYGVDRPTLEATTPGVRALGEIAFSRDGRWAAAFAPTDFPATVTADVILENKKPPALDRIALIDRRTQRVARWIPGPKTATGHLAFSADGRRLVVADILEAVGHDTETGAEVFRRRTEDAKLVAAFDRTFFLPDGRLVAIGQEWLRGKDDDRPLRLVDLAAGKTLFQFPSFAGGGPHVTPSADGGRVVVDSPMHAFLQTGGPPTTTFELPGGRVVGSFPGPGRTMVSQLLAMTPAGDIGAFLTIDVMSGGNSLRNAVWEVRRLADGETLMRIPNRGLGENSNSFSPDGRLLALSGDRGQAEVWDVPARSLLFRFQPQGGKGLALLGFSPDGDLVTAANNDNRLTTLKWADLRGRMTALGLGW